DAETAQQEADIRLGEAEIANTEAKALVDQKTLEVEAARVALEQANANAATKVEPATLAHQTTDKAKAAEAIATALAAAAGTAAETAAAKAAAAQTAAEEADAALLAAGDAATAAREQATDAATFAENAVADVETAEQAVVTATTVAQDAERALTQAEESAAAAARAGGNAATRLEEANAERLTADTALEEASEALAEANQRWEAAGTDVADKERSQADILAQARVILDELRAVREAAAAASEGAAEARDAAQQASERAAALPDGWPRVTAETDRAALLVPVDTVTVTDAALDVVVEPALMPISNAPPVIPRPRPDRSVSRVAEPTPIIDAGPILPTDSRPLVINPPN
ncbi:MAG: hypothetical protein GY798_06235, partial [Hyphomicrobiales bacterium]|nr:hypothetical protein [Hyphomicrobiales bacterium]